LQSAPEAVTIADVSAGNPKTTVLARGRHRDAAQGVCAMELSSMLGDERFSDHPQRVCPVVAAFLRGYNDGLPARLRQELYGIAASVIDSRTADPRVREDRAAALLGWPVEVWAARRLRTPWPPTFTPENAFADLEEAGAYVARRARRDRGVHERTVAFVEALVARPDAGGPLPAVPAPAAQPLAPAGH
jgi:hypothetical protein